MVPDFLGIGAQKAGTTWLHANLSRHPEVWLPPLKEVHYFDKACRYPSPWSRRYYDERWRRQFSRRLGQRLTGGLGTRDLRWDLNYFFGRRTDAWYASLFEPGRGRRCGEITPAYSKLEPHEVERIRDLCPEARILYLLRDPIDRAWSGARMAFDRRGLDLADEARWQAYCDTQRTGRGDYLRTLKTWSALFPRERIFVGSFDEIRSDPAALLTRVHAFLGVSSGPEFLPADLRRSVNASSSHPMPLAVEAYLARVYLDDLVELRELLGALVEPWLQRARRAVAGGRVEAR